MDTLRILALELLRRQPAVYADLVNGEFCSVNIQVMEVHLLLQLKMHQSGANVENAEQCLHKKRTSDVLE